MKLFPMVVGVTILTMSTRGTNKGKNLATAQV
jgi:hypothetical protein